MIKTIPQSDIRIRPFKVYKEFQLTQDDINTGSLSGHKKLIAKRNDWVDDLPSPSASLWASIHRMYYDDIYNPITSYGTISKNVNSSPLLQFRKLEDEAIVFTIEQKKFGEKIKPGTFSLIDEIRGNTFLDINKDGVLYSDVVDTTWTLFNAETDKFIISDAALVEYELELVSFNADSGLLNLIYDGTPGTLKIKYLNANTGGIVIFDVTQFTFDFITGFQVAPAGNIFYEHGIAVVTQLEDVNTDFTQYTIDYKSTKTIYENEYFISVEPDEFNYSTNPTAYYEIGAETGSLEISATSKIRTWKNPGQRYILQSGSIENGTTYDYRRPFSITYESGSRYLGEYLTSSLIVSGKYGFGVAEVTKSFDNGARFEYTSSISIEDSLTPYITTIGLYDENYDMIAVAKLPTPIKVYPDYPVNFLVRIDT